ncbi:MAG: twin-arginine translocase TatA/TatE family subunit [Pseudomonadota bacterium]
MGIGWPQLLLIALVILVLFGRGRISEMMGDFGKGISSFKKGMAEDVDETPAAKAQIEAPAKDAGTAETTPSETGDTAKS